jgi:hypothetical protein
VLFHGSRLHVAPAYEGVFKSNNLRTPEDVVRLWIKEPADPARRSRVAEHRIPRGGGSEHWFVKTYDYFWPDRFRTLFIPARAKREFMNLEGLARLHLPVPEAVAWGQTRRLGFVTCSFLITRAIENAVDLRDLADTGKAPFPLPSRRERLDLIRTFARRLRRCHDEGWFIHTLFFKNLLLARGAAGYEIHVIDVPFARIWRNRLRPEAGRRRDFACLEKGAVGFISRTERMRFVRAYMATGERLSRADKSFLRSVTREVARF